MIKHLKMKTTKFIISIAFAVFVSISNVNSQVSISYYQGGNSKIGIAKTFNHPPKIRTANSFLKKTLNLLL